MPVPDPGGGGARGHVPPPLHEEDVSVLKKFFFAQYIYGNGLVEFVVFWGVSMDRTTIMLTDQIRKRVCLALPYRSTDSFPSRCRIARSERRRDARTCFLELTILAQIFSMF